MQTLRRFVIGLVVAYTVACPTGARADYDMSGAWSVGIREDAHWDVVQSAGTLQVTMPDTYTHRGTIDAPAGKLAKRKR